MKNAYFLIAGLLMAGTLCAADIGRYQLFQGYYTADGVVNGEQGKSQEKSVFRIDTTTGEVWIYKELTIVDKRAGVGQSKSWELVDSKFKNLIVKPPFDPSKPFEVEK